MRIKRWRQLTQRDCPAVFTPKQVRQVREMAGFTPAEMAGALGVSQSTISRWESGKLVPSVRDCLAMRMVALYADVLGPSEPANVSGVHEAGPGCHAV